MKILPGQQKVVYNDGVVMTDTVEVENQASLVYLLALTGGGSKSVELKIHLKGKQAQSKVIGFFKGEKDSKFRIKIEIIQEAPLTSGEVIVKGILKDSACCFFRGLMKINKEALNSEGMLTHHTLLLSGGAKVDSLPFLEIDTDEVKAGHAVTVSSLDEEQLFYLKSRGLKTTAAKKLISQGFLSDVLEKMTSEVSSSKNI